MKAEAEGHPPTRFHRAYIEGVVGARGPSTYSVGVRYIYRQIYTQILPQILGSLPEVIRSWCAHHHHHHHQKVFARPFGVERSLSRSQPPEPSGGRPWEAAFGQRHPSRPASRRSIGRPRHLEPDR